MRFPFWRYATNSRSPQISASRIVNLYPELYPQTSKGMVALVRTPGTVSAGNLANASRGSHVFNGVVYHVAGNKLYSFDGANVSATLGTLATSNGPVYMSDNGLMPTGGNQLMIVDGPNGYIYNVSPLPVVTITGDGTGATTQTIIANGSITTINVVNAGSNYTTATVQIFGGGGSGANASAVLSGGTLSSIIITNSGSGYSVPPTVTISGGGGANAAATVYAGQVVNGQIANLTITNTGSNYTSAPTVTLTAPANGGNVATAVATVKGSNISSITVANGGSGYNTPIFSQLTSAGGSGAAATATLSPGVVSQININSNVSYAGYVAGIPPKITFSGGGGVGASAQAIISAGSGMTAHATLSGNSVATVVYDNAGANYAQTPITTFYGGNGSGANALVNLTGSLSLSVTVTNPGHYSILYPPTINFDAGNNGGSGAAAYCIMGSADSQQNAPVASVFVSNQGSGYITSPAVSFVGGAVHVQGGYAAVNLFSADSQLYYVAKGIAVVNGIGTTTTIGSGGSNYTSAPNVLIENPIASIGLVSGGSGYTSAPTVTLTGIISGINITSGGGGYAANSSNVGVIISGGGGSGATAHGVSNAGGVLTNIIIDNPGSGYTSAANVNISGNATATSNFSAANATANISRPIGYITVTNPGSLYSSPPQVVISDPTGTGASAISNVYNGIVVGVTVTSGGANYTNPTVSFTANTGTGWNANGANSVCFLNGSFIIGIGQGSSSFQVSNLYDGMLWSSLNTAAKSVASDPLISVFNNLGWLYLFGNTTSEIWQNTGIGSPPFAWSSSYDFGLAAQASVAKGDNSVFWLGTQKNNDGGEFTGVIEGSSGGAKIISPQWLNYQISQMTTISDAVGYCYTQEGHTFYVITFPTGNATYVYDASMPPEFAWHERSFWTGSLYTTGRHKGQYYSYYKGKHYVTDYSTGNIYYLDSTTYTDNGTAIGRLVISSPVFDGETLYNIFHNSVQIDAVLGSANGTVNLSWSNNGGVTWTADKGRAITAGDYFTRLRWSALGYDRSRIYRISTSDPMSIILIDAYADVEKGTT